MLVCIVVSNTMYIFATFLDSYFFSIIPIFFLYILVTYSNIIMTGEPVLTASKERMVPEFIFFSA